MNFAVDDTIAAVASPPGGSVRGVIRVSGPGTLSCLRRCFRAAGSTTVDDVRVPTRIFGHLHMPPPIGALPCHLYLWPTSRSYTRQPAAELHTIGSPPLLDAALDCVCQGGARLARPGEFTLRAFLAGRLDLTQAEAVLGVIDAENTRELHTALVQLAGGLSKPLLHLRGTLLDLLARIEAGLDFVDEDIEFVTSAQIDVELAEALESIDDVLTQLVARGEAGAEPCVVLRGYPNVGKSSLLNALVNSDAAIVSPQAGTTRDYVSRPFHWQDVSGTLIDTQGFADAGPQETLAQAAQRVAVDQARLARLVLVCLDVSRPLDATQYDLLCANLAADRLMIVWTKADLVATRDHGVPGAMYTSSRTGEGLVELRTAIVRRISGNHPAAGAAVASTAVRCRQSLEAAAVRLRTARHLAATGAGEELIAVDLRDALDELGQVVGAVYTDDILDRIFSRFCIGK